MRRIATAFPRTLLLVIVAFAGRAADAQCVDWFDGFGYPGYGLHTLASEPHEMAAFDDGTGRDLYVLNYAPPNGQYLARFDGSNWSAVPGASAGVSAMAVFDDGGGEELYVAARVNLTMGTEFQVSRWNGTNWTPLSGIFDHSVATLCVHDDGTGPALYAGGTFASISGASFERVAKWNGTSWATMPGGGMDSTVETLTSYSSPSGPRLVASGGFSMAGGSPAHHLAAWNGATWSTLGPSGPSGSFSDIFAVHACDLGAGEQLFVGGHFNFMGGVPAENIARFDGTSWSSVGTVPLGGLVSALADFDDGSGRQLYAGGFFGTGGPTLHQMARWNGSIWSDVQGGVQSGSGLPVRAMAECHSRLYVGGPITAAGGKPASKLAAFGAPCNPPSVAQQPLDATAVFPQFVHMDVTAYGLQPMTYQWRRDQVPLANITDVIAGAQTAHLTLFEWSFNDAGAYDCVITNALGTTTSNTATLTVPAGGLTGYPFSLTTVLHPPATANGLMPGEIITQVGSCAQARTGEVVVGGRIDGAAYSLFLRHGGVLDLIARAGDHADLLPASVSYEALGNGFAGDNGIVGYRAVLSGPGVDINNNEALYVRDSQGLALAARLGDPAPGAVTNGVFKRFLPSPYMGPGGHMAVGAEVSVAGVTQQRGIWTWDRVNGLRPLALTGTSAPGTPHTFTSFNQGPLLVDVNGRVAFTGRLSNSTNASFVGTPGAVQKLVAVGDPLPGLPVGSVAEQEAFDMLMNDSGDVVCRIFSANLGNAWGMYRFSNGTLTPLLVTGGVAPGVPSSKTYYYGQPFAFNTQGHVAFFGTLQGSCTGTCPNEGLWIWKPTGIVPVAFDAGVPWPEIPVAWNYLNIISVSLSNADQVLFGVRFHFGSSFDAAFGWTQTSGIFPVAVPGSQFEITPGQFGTVLGAQGALISSGSSASGPSTALSNTGMAVLNMSFTNLDPGVFSGSFANLLGLYFPCPHVQSQPPPGTFVLTGQDVTLPTTASGGGTLQYRWSRNGADLFDNGHLTGTDTDTLVIHGAQPNDSGNYAVRVFNICGIDESDAAWVDVGPGIPYCSGDGSGTACPCANASTLGRGVGCLNSLGLGSSLRANGTPSLGGDTLILEGRSMPNSSALYFQGTTQVNGGMGAAFGDGLRCAGGSVVRLGTQTNAVSTSTYPEAGDLPVSVKGGITVPGSVRTYQVWYRNAATFCTASTFNLTNGYVITWGA